MEAIDEISESRIPAVAIMPPGFLAIHRKDWERVNAEVMDLRKRLDEALNGRPTVDGTISAMVENVIRTAATCSGFSLEMIRSQSRKPDLVDVRTAIVALLRDRGVTLVAIARGMHRDHTSISGLEKRHRQLCDIDARYRMVLVHIFDACNSPKPN